MYNRLKCKRVQRIHVQKYVAPTQEVCFYQKQSYFFKLKYVFRIYVAEKSIGSVWLGVHRVDNVWYKANNEKLYEVELDVVDTTAEGDCMVLDVDQGFRGRIVSCDETYAVSTKINIFILILWF